MDTTKRSPLDRLLFATFLKGRTSSRDIWEEKGDMTPEDNKKIIEETNEIINDDSTYRQGCGGTGTGQHRCVPRPACKTDRAAGGKSDI